MTELEIKVRDVVTHVAKLKWRWVGNIIIYNKRVKNARWNKNTGNWRPYMEQISRGLSELGRHYKEGMEQHGKD